ncbi:MAG: hypothetical protein WDW38_004701 [Sanguina aurantia]
MDDISDQLCRVYDAAECCRNIHSDQRWRQAAGRACGQLGAYINEVNHHEGLFLKLQATLDSYHHTLASTTAHPTHGHPATDRSNVPPPTDTTTTTTGGRARQVPMLSPAQLAAFDEETLRVGTALLNDMRQAGIGLPPAQRAAMQDLLNQGSHFATQFNDALVDPTALGTVTLSPPTPAAGLDPSFFSRFKIQKKTAGGVGGGRILSLDGPSMRSALALERDEGVRRQIYVAGANQPACNGPLLDQMVSTRRELAHLMGCESYAEYRAQQGSVAGTATAVRGFLEGLASEVKPMAEAELQVLRRLKIADNDVGSQGHGSPFQSWDMEHYLTRAGASSMAQANAVRRGMSSHFHLLPLLEGFCNLMRQTFNLDLKLTSVSGSATWAPGVLLLDATHPTMGHMGTVYLDLLNRPGKYPSAVTFPIICGRALNHTPASSRSSAQHSDSDYTAQLDANIQRSSRSSSSDSSSSNLDPHSFTSSKPQATASSQSQHQSHIHPQVPQYQAPIMVLLASFGPLTSNGTTTGDVSHSSSSSSSGVGDGWTSPGPVLQPDELRVLLHELGHVCHSLMSRTRYQHLWGTRCAQDLVEVPSHLWEHFASDPRTIAAIARHAKTGDPLSLNQSTAASKGMRRPFAALELQGQILLSIVDQTLFGPGPIPANGGTSQAWATVTERHGSLPVAEGTRPELRVGHFSVYGGTYYSYLYARCLSSALWDTYLAADPFDPCAGDVLRQKLLHPGGAQDPLQLLQGLLGRDVLQPIGNGWAPATAGLLQRCREDSSA